MGVQASAQALRHLPVAAPRSVLACGAWLKNTACRLEGNGLRWSPLHGDLSDPAACDALRVSAQALADLGPLQAVAHDLHPDFYSTRVAVSLAETLGIPAIAVQHHHAHIAALQAEHGLTQPVIGLALDGVGLGTDGLPWGGELLWVQGARWQRLGHLSPLALPGGDAAAREPWRMAASALHAQGRGDEIEPRLGAAHGVEAVRTVRTLLDRRLNAPMSSSAGRWFDAAAGALGWGQAQASEAQAAIALEQAAAQWLAGHELRVDEADAPLNAEGGLDLHPLMRRLWALEGRQQAEGAALFHVALADGLARWAVRAAHEHDVDTVVLGGGCFMNRVLSAHLVQRIAYLSRSEGHPGLRVCQAQALSCGDAGLALGQAWVAAHTDLSSCSGG